MRFAHANGFLHCHTQGPLTSVQLHFVIKNDVYDCFNTVKWKVPTNHWVQYSRQCPLIHTVEDNKCKWATGRHSESVQYSGRYPLRTESPEGTHKQLESGRYTGRQPLKTECKNWKTTINNWIGAIQWKTTMNNWVSAIHWKTTTNNWVSANKLEDNH